MKKKQEKDIVLFFVDEMRYGLMSNYKRSWSKIGKRVIIKNQMEFANAYLYSAINPIDGETVHLLGFKAINSATTYKFLEELKKLKANKQIIVIWDNAPFHRLKALTEIEDISILFLPAYSPQLNPVERLFEELRRATANRIFKSLKEQEQIIKTKLLDYLNNKEAVKRLCSYDWIERQYEEGVS